jgi:hypothetical protein
MAWLDPWQSRRKECRAVVGRELRIRILILREKEADSQPKREGGLHNHTTKPCQKDACRHETCWAGYENRDGKVLNVEVVAAESCHLVLILQKLPVVQSTQLFYSLLYISVV